MNAIIESLVTDRTQANTEALRSLSAFRWDDMTAAQKAEYAANLKGAYTAEDMNRVISACAYLYEVFLSYGYEARRYGYVAIEPNLTDARYLSESFVSQYLANVAALKAVWVTIQEIPDTMKSLTVDGANDIEKLLAEVDHWQQVMPTGYIFSGEAFSGEF